MSGREEHNFHPKKGENLSVLCCDIYDDETNEKTTVYAYQTFDKNKRLTNIKIENDIEINLTYYPNGNISTYTDNFGNEYKFTEDKKITYIKHQDKSEETITYNSNGLEATRSFKDGSSYENIYDKKGVLVKRVWNDGTTTVFEYNKDKRLSHEYTLFNGCSDKLNEVIYTYEINVNKYDEREVNVIENHVGDLTFVTFKKESDYYQDCTYTKYQDLNKITVNPKSFVKLPKETKFVIDMTVNNYNLFIEKENIYLFPSNSAQTGYRFNGKSFTTASLVPFTPRDDNFPCVQRFGDLLFVQNRVFYKSFENEIVFEYETISQFYDEMGEKQGLYRQAMYDEHYAVPKGIVCSNGNYHGEVLCGVELDGGIITKFIPMEKLDDWLKSQGGNYSLENYQTYGYNRFRVLKDEKVLPYNGNYVGSINNQFPIYKGKDNTFFIYNENEIIEECFTVPENISKFANYGFDENGKMYGVVPAEFKTRVTSNDVESFTLFTQVEGSQGEILTFTGHLKNFGYLNDSGVRLRKYPSTSSASMGSFAEDTAFKVIGKTTKPETIGGQTGVWYHVRLADGTEGYFFGAFVTMFE